MTNQTTKSNKRTNPHNQIKYTPNKRKPVSGKILLKLVGAPGYLTTSFAWILLVGFVCYQFLSTLGPLTASQTTTRDSSPLANIISERYIYNPNLVTQILSYAVVIVVVIFSILITAYFLKTFVRYSALLINWVAKSLGPPERMYFIKIESGLLGWLLLALTIIYRGEILWVAALVSSFAMSISSISFIVEKILFKKIGVSETDIWE